ncbi:MAG: hypothetical protein K8T89_02800 [Planctomycetes bacterium]|nr:hypothetical protein [Planctomycetota bacterium]
MARVLWPLLSNRPRIQVILTDAFLGRQSTRDALADTGGGSARSPFEFVLDENDCVVYGGKRVVSVQLRGFYTGVFPLYRLRVQIPQLGFDRRIRVIGVPAVSALEGIACFRFLNRFTYGNFGDSSQFGLEA